jgi:hypothetical protein
MSPCGRHHTDIGKHAARRVKIVPVIRAVAVDEED